MPRFLILIVLLLGVTSVGAQPPLQLLEQLDTYPHALAVDSASTAVVDHEVGLGAIKKVRGAWQFKDSERISGQRHQRTWQIVDGFSAAEVMAELEQALAQRQGVELLFSCDGRSCGKGVQWANRVFGQRVLYGREDMQRYRAYKLQEGSEYRLLMYAGARTADRQYLHVELIAVTAP